MTEEPTVIFDGIGFVRARKSDLKDQVHRLKKRKVRPRLVTILTDKNKASVLYLNMKKKFGQDIGVKVDILKANKVDSVEVLLAVIQKLNEDKKIQGVMIQLPLAKRFRGDKKRLLSKIDKAKDVDGLNEDSGIVPATSRAVHAIIEDARKITNTPKNVKTVVIGSEGNVGKATVKYLKKKGYKVWGHDKKYNFSPTKSVEDIAELTRSADILVTAAGSPNLIDRNIVKEGAIVIDVGSPAGDIWYHRVWKKTKFITPVPGGVGPVTVMSLFENLLDACEKLAKK